MANQATNLNPFHRSRMTIQEPLRMVACEYEGWSRSYKVTYVASRSASDSAALMRQFKSGTPLVVDGKHLVATGCTITVDNSHQCQVEVTAVDFASVFAAATATQQPLPSPSKIPESERRPAGGLAPVVKAIFGGNKRRILQ